MLLEFFFLSGVKARSNHRTLDGYGPSLVNMQPVKYTDFDVFPRYSWGYTFIIEVYILTFCKIKLKKELISNLFTPGFIS